MKFLFLFSFNLWQYLLLVDLGGHCSTQNMIKVESSPPQRFSNIYRFFFEHLTVIWWGPKKIMPIVRCLLYGMSAIDMTGLTRNKIIIQPNIWVQNMFQLNQCHFLLSRCYPIFRHSSSLSAHLFLSFSSITHPFSPVCILFSKKE